MSNAPALITQTADAVRPFDETTANTLTQLAGLDMHPRAAMRRVRQIADNAKSSARPKVHDLADELGRIPAGPEAIDLHVASIRRALGNDPAADPRALHLVLTGLTDERMEPLRDPDGRVRVYDPKSRRVGWAELANVEWTDTLP